MINRIVYTSFLLGASFASTEAQVSTPPNIVLILCDDMGFSDLGCYGSEIQTPNIDRLAENGVRFSLFKNTGRSCPSRAALLTGHYQHEAGMGWMTAVDPGTEKYGGRHEHSHLPEHGRVCKQEKICMSQMREDTYLPGCGILQELSGYVLCIYRIRESPERIISGI